MRRNTRLPWVLCCETPKLATSGALVHLLRLHLGHSGVSENSSLDSTPRVLAWIIAVLINVTFAMRHALSVVVLSLLCATREGRHVNREEALIGYTERQSAEDCNDQDSRCSAWAAQRPSECKHLAKAALALVLHCMNC